MSAQKRVWATTALILGSAIGLLAQDGDLTSEIKRMRKELMQVQEERARVTDEKEKDIEDFREYRKRTQQRFRGIRQETDSVQALVRATRFENDSLQALINGARNRKKQYELMQDDLRKSIITACDAALAAAAKEPPLIADKHTSALKLLQTELQNASVDNVEGVTRLMQVLRDMNDLTGTIQIVQGNSPIPEIRGTTYRLRIGTMFEAVVNAKGTQAAVWTGWDDTGNPEWKEIDDAVLAGNILTAVNVREGKSLPELVELPFSHVGVVKGEQ